MMDGWLRADLGETRICSKLIDGTYPNYLKVVPGKAHEGRATLASAPIARIAAMANAAWRHMRKDLVLDLKAGEMRVTQPDGDQITHPLQSSGDFQIGICLRYIQEQMKATPDVSLTVASPGEPILVQPEDPNALFVLMPVRVR
jgi:DNA polymerase-3 subunit beta